MFKINLCTKSGKREDYAPVSYQKVERPAKPFCDDTSSLFSTVSAANSDYSECSDQNLDCINISKWHSTKLDECSLDQSATPYFSTNYASVKKLSSTIQEQAKALAKRGYYNTAIDLQADCTAISHKPSYLQLPSQIETTYSSCDTCSNNDYTETSEDFYSMADFSQAHVDDTTVFPSSLVTNSYNSSNDSDAEFSSSTLSHDSFGELDSYYNSDYYVCISAYKPKFEGDLCIRYLDKVKVVNNNSNPQNNYVFVQLLKNGKYGYLPRKCLISLAQFLSL